VSDLDYIRYKLKVRAVSGAPVSDSTAKRVGGKLKKRKRKNLELMLVRW